MINHLPFRWLLVLVYLVGLFASEIGNTGDKEVTDQCDVVLLTKRPILLRIHLSLDGGNVRAARENYIDALIAEVDSDGDGQLLRKETIRSPFLTRTGHPRGNTGFFDVLRNLQPVPREEIQQAIRDIAGDWINFFDDKNAAVNDNMIFDYLNADRSPTLDDQEIASAGQLLRKRDVDGDGCIILDEIAYRESEVLALFERARENRSRPAPSFLLIDVASDNFASTILRTYDVDGDGRLTQHELRRPSVAAIDEDGDQALSTNELVRLPELGPDLELRVRLGRVPEGCQPLEIIACSISPHGSADGSQNQPLRFDFPDLQLTIAFQEVPSLEKVVADAMDLFDQLDGNKNGYLEPGEADLLLPGQRQTFNAIDADNNQLVFRDELTHYIQMRAKPVAASGKILLSDKGYGFFSGLDCNEDGRISERELRLAAESLNAMQRDDEPGLSLDEPIRNIHLEFSQGTFEFVQNVRPNAQTSKKDEKPTTRPGPVWFQRMDRNSDGDLDWVEFLGPKTTFEQLDRDKDGLIDATEAASAQ